VTEITVPEDDFKKVVSAEEADEDYQIDVLQGRGRLVHSRSLAVQGSGKRVLPGDRPTIRNLDDKPLYAAALEGSGDLVLDVSGTSFTADLQAQTQQSVDRVESIVNNDPRVIELLEEIAANTSP